MPVFMSSSKMTHAHFPSRYSIRIKDAFGNKLPEFPYYAAQYSVVTNEIGACSLTIPATVPRDMLKVDNRIEFWKGVEGNTFLDPETCYLIKSVQLSRDENGRYVWIVGGKTLNVILRSRIVAYNQGTAGAQKTATSDNMMKAIVRENLGSSATTGRNISAYLSVQADVSLGASITKAFEYRPLFEVFAEIVEESLATASPVYFDIVLNDRTAEFRTYVGTRGTDKRIGTASPVVIGPAYSNVGPFTINDNYEEEYTFTYVIGPANLDARMIATASNTTQINRGPFGRIELATNTSSNNPNSTNLTQEANALLQLGRSRRVVEGSILQSPETIYGKHWKMGDILSFRDGTWVFDVRVDAVDTSISESRVEIQGYFRG